MKKISFRWSSRFNKIHKKGARHFELFDKQINFSHVVPILMVVDFTTNSRISVLVSPTPITAILCAHIPEDRKVQ